MKSSLRYIVAFLIWNGVAGLLLLMPNVLIGIPLSLAVTAYFFYGYLLRRPTGWSDRRRWALIGLRRLSGDRLRWTLVAAPVLLTLSFALGELYMQLIPVPAESLNPFESILDTPSGRLAISVFAIGVAPIIEEFLFRGLIQGTLERLYGPAVGITVAAALFGLVHLLPWVFPLHFFLGVAFGFAVYATRSVWAGVVLHAANNIAAMVGTILAGGETETTPTLWEIGITADLWIAIVLLIGSSLVAAWTVRGLLASRRRPSLSTV